MRVHALKLGVDRMSTLLLVLLLAACAPVRVREDASLARLQAMREQTFAVQPNWALSARISVSNGGDGGSGQLEWRQIGDQYDFIVHAPVTGKTWRLHGDADGAVLEGVDAEPLRGSDPSELLRESVGWVVPLKELTLWARAQRAPQGEAQISYNDHGLPAILQQSGWTVEYKDYFDDLTPPLPRKVFAAKTPYRVRMVIEHWSFEP
jgi:outer membrane lipoprotein LolB